MEEKLLWCEGVIEAVEQASPSQIVRQVLGSDTTEACHPSFEVGIVSIDALYMPDAIASLAVECRDKGTGFDLQLLGDGPVGGVAVCTQYCFSAQHRAQGIGQGYGCALRKHLVKLNLRATLHGYYHSDLLGPFASLKLAGTLL